ncbi:MAG: phosphomannomutase/phosphoglucomutase [Patescibacteria group bacterium]
MQIPEEIFRVYDIRGLLDQVTSDIARKAAQVLVKRTGAKTVVVGRDMRATSPELLAAAIGGITSLGVNVINIGMTTTPLYCFAVRNLEVEAGIMITASHNPPEYNGMKFADKSGFPISGLDIRTGMEDAYEEKTTRGAVSDHTVLKAYLDACLLWPGVQDAAKGVKIVADYGNGMGALTLRPLAERLGIELIELFPEPDARFPNHEANPAKEETLNVIKAEVVKRGADFGVALDGDADRIAFIDNEGQSLRGDLALVVFAKELLQRLPGSKFIVAPNQSWMTTDTITELGGETIESPIGRTLMIRKMFEHKAALSGEVSSHFFFPEFGNLEAVEHAFVRMLCIWRVSGMTFADMVRPLRQYHNTGEINFSVADKVVVLQRIKEVYGAEASVVNTLDGVRCDFDRDWWFIVRPSNNEPLIRLMIEAKSQALMEMKRDELTKFIQAV